MRAQGQRDPEQEREAYCVEICRALLGISRKKKKLLKRILIVLTRSECTH